MAKDKKQVEQITSRDADFTQWYTDVVKKAELVDYSGVKGLFVLRPYAYALWENIQSALDKKFKELGHENVYMPMLIPESLLNKEKDHVEGFAPEVAWVTHGGTEELAERLCVRPTSETLFCEHYAHVVHSWRDLPKLYNQWCSVLRWEKTTRPFLRHREFLWQEGHTLHETAQEAMDETMRMLEVYADLCENWLAMPVIRGRKTDREKFAGAEATYTVECMMHDRKALQSGTSHYFGDGFARAFGIQFTDRNNNLTAPFQTSWGLSTRLIGGIIMTHGDDSGLVMPPRVAPTQVIVLPIAQHKPGVIEAAQNLCDSLCTAGIRAKVDVSDQSAGWKFAEYEMKGVPLRVEIGPRDIEAGVCVMARRTGGERISVPIAGAAETAKEQLELIHKELFGKAMENMTRNTFEAHEYSDFGKILENGGGFIKAMWCGDEACEEKLKAEHGITSRCMPLKQENIDGRCAICGRPADKMVIWGVAY